MSFDRYFKHDQKVFLINISEERDKSVYNSFTGKVVSCQDEQLLLKTVYRLFTGDQLQLRPGMQFKLTTETLGMGIQVRAELIQALSQDELKLKVLGDLSVYQRRTSTRVDVRLPLLHVPQNSSLATFQREWRRVLKDLHRPDPPRIKMTEQKLNLSTGGLRIDLPRLPAQLSLIVLDLLDERPPVCAVTELVWHKLDEEHGVLQCGHRFVEILKDDQERVAALVDKAIGVRSGSLKQRELIDRMVP